MNPTRMSCAAWSADVLIDRLSTPRSDRGCFTTVASPSKASCIASLSACSLYPCLMLSTCQVGGSSLARSPPNVRLGMLERATRPSSSIVASPPTLDCPPFVASLPSESGGTHTNTTTTSRHLVPGVPTPKAGRPPCKNNSQHRPRVPGF